jgi:hypothetical protein
VFKTTSGLDTEQAAFLERIRRWDEGLLYGRFSNPGQLKDEIVKALSAHVRRGAVVRPSDAAHLLSELLNSLEWPNSDLVIALALVTDARRPLLGLDAIDDLTEKLPTLLAEVPALGASGGRVIGKERGAIMSARGKGGEPSAFLEVVDDGRMVCYASLSLLRRTDLAGAFYIDAEEAERKMVELLGGFDAALRYLDPRSSVGHVFLQGRLRGTNRRLFAPIPAEPVSSMTIPVHDLPDPMTFPTRPLQIARSNLNDPRRLASTLRGAIRRRFDEALSRSA